MTLAKRILVCMDRTPRDATLMAFASAMCRMANVEAVVGFHQNPLPADRPPDAPDIDTTTQAIRQAVQADAEAAFDGPGEPQVLVSASSEPLDAEILRVSRENDVDLILVGRHRPVGVPSANLSPTARRVAAKAACSVLAVSMTDRPAFARVLVPFRATHRSVDALEAAVHIARNVPGAGVICHYVYPVHAGYNKTGVSYDELIQTLEAHGREEFDQLVRAVDASGVDVSLQLSPDEADEPAAAFARGASEFGADLIAIGSHCHQGAAGIVLGTVAEDLICQSPVPVLDVKQKGNVIGLIDAILTSGS